MPPPCAAALRRRPAPPPCAAALCTHAAVGRRVRLTRSACDSARTPSQITPTAQAEMQKYADVPTLCCADQTFWARLTPGALGCALSHRQVWEWFDDDEDLGDAVLVLEDDVTLCDIFVVRLQSVLQQLRRKPSWRVCLLGSHELGGTLASRRATLQSRDMQQGQNSSGLFAYLVHRRALPLLLGDRARRRPSPPSQRERWGAAPPPPLRARGSRRSSSLGRSASAEGRARQPPA